MHPVQSDPIRPFRVAHALFLGLILAAILAAATLAAPGAPRESHALVRCDPQVIKSEKETFSIDLSVQDATNFSGADLQLTYDPSIVSAIDANPTAGGVQMELLDDLLRPDFVVRNIIDPGQSKIWYAAAQILAGGEEAANGSGPLARLSFEPLKSGKFDLQFTETTLATPDGFEIAHAAADCNIEIVDKIVFDTFAFLPIAIRP